MHEGDTGLRCRRFSSACRIFFSLTSSAERLVEQQQPGAEIIERASATRCCSSSDNWRGKREIFRLRCMRSAISRTCARSRPPPAPAASAGSRYSAPPSCGETAPASGTMLVGRSDAGAGHVLALDRDPAAVRVLSPRPFQQRGLAAARRSHQRHELRAHRRLTPFSANAAPLLFTSTMSGSRPALCPCSAPRQAHHRQPLHPSSRFGLGIHDLPAIARSRPPKLVAGKRCLMTAECLRDIARPTAPTPASDQIASIRRCSRDAVHLRFS